MPRPGAVETLRALRELGVLVGLITVCSEDVEDALARVGVRRAVRRGGVLVGGSASSKPDPRIYLHCCELLGVEPSEAVFVGDGANDELAGAQRVGMRRDPHPPARRSAALGRSWSGSTGPRVTSIPEVLEVLELC